MNITLLDKALARVKEKSGWKKMLAHACAVRPDAIDGMIENRDSKIIASIYQLAGMGGKSLLAETNVKKMTWIMIEAAAKGKRLFFSTGPTGCGKSYTAKAVIEELEDEYSVAYLYVSRVTGRSQSCLLDAVANSFKGFNIKRNSRTLGYVTYRRIVSLFNDMHGCLVIDEAQNLTANNLEVLRSLYDECDLSFVFMASRKFYEQLDIPSLDQSDFGQFIRRADNKYALVHATPADVRAFLSMYGISITPYEGKRIAQIISKHGDIDTLNRALREIARINEERDLDWSLVGAGDIEEAILYVKQTQKVDNLVKEAA